jgi:hypothetical protein
MRTKTLSGKSELTAGSRYRLLIRIRIIPSYHRMESRLLVCMRSQRALPNWLSFHLKVEKPSRRYHCQTESRPPICAGPGTGTQLFTASQAAESQTSGRNPLMVAPSKQLTNFTSDRIFFFDFSRDGKQVALSRGTLTRDVVLISNFK